jgi:exosome complex protein LRP1
MQSGRLEIIAIENPPSQHESECIPDRPSQSVVMDSTKVLSLLEQLDDEVDDLEETLAPLLQTALSETSSKLPLLDKAKLYVLVTYAIESILFCKSPHSYTVSAFLTLLIAYLRLNGVNAREHPVFIELTRVKQYFDKIKKAEFPPERTMVVDRKAAARFIKASLVCIPATVDASFS